MPKKLFRRLAMGPAAAISAVIVFLLMSLLGLLNFNFNPPSTEESSVESEQDDDAPKSDAASLVAVDTPPTETPEETTEPTELTPVEIVDVLIDGDDYWVGIGLQDGELKRETRTIGEITRAGLDCEGDESGVRVRVARTFNATAQAEQSLMDALADAGLKGDEIDRRRTLVSGPGGGI